MFNGAPPHVAHMKVKSNMPSFYMPDELKMEILNKSAITMAQIDLTQNSGVYISYLHLVKNSFCRRYNFVRLFFR